MRALITVLIVSLIATGCATNAYRIPNDELARLTQMPPDQRGRQVRMIQEIRENRTQPQPAVANHTQIEINAEINVSNGPRFERTRGGGGSGGKGARGGGVNLSGGGDGKGMAIVVLIAAVVALAIVAGVEGSRFDGWSEVHPMHPIHLFGHNGDYTVLPLASIDEETVKWTKKAVLVTSEGPWRPIRRAPLWRDGATYGVYGGSGTLYSADGQRDVGPAFTIQGGYFVNHWLGVLGNLAFAWRDNQMGGVVFETRTMLELQALPLRLGKAHAGGFGAVGLAWRLEDDVRGSLNSRALSGGAMLQFDVNTRIALTARLGVTRALGERTTDAVFGISVY